MNRYPVWKYAIILFALMVGAIYTLPNFFGEAPAVQVSSGKATVKVDAAVQRRVEQAIAAAGLQAREVTLEGTSVRVRLDSTEVQLKAKGMTFNYPDVKTFRDSLSKAGFYKEWRAKFGDEAMAKLEKYSGKLA